MPIPAICILQLWLASSGLKPGCWLQEQYSSPRRSAFRRNRHGDLGFQVAFSTAVFSLLIRENSITYRCCSFLQCGSPIRCRRIRDAGPFNQLALNFVRVALLAFWCATAVGGFLMHSGPMGRAIGWWLSSNAVFPVLAAVAAMMVVQRFSHDLIDHGHAGGEYAMSGTAN